MLTDLFEKSDSEPISIWCDLQQNMRFEIEMFVVVKIDIDLISVKQKKCWNKCKPIWLIKLLINEFSYSY